MTSAYASPASSFADSIERAAAGARFSSVGRQLLGPRLPVAIDWNDPPPEVRSRSHRSPYDRVGVVNADPQGLCPASLSAQGPSRSIPALDAFQLRF
jgi:hypothetical protein